MFLPYPEKTKQQSNPLIMIFLILLLLVTTPQESILEEGLRYEEAGNYAEALETWERAFLEYEKPSFIIAREYIRVATKYQLKGNYKTASSMYFWGLSDTTFHEKDLSTYYNEVEFLEPLMKRSISGKLKELLDNKNQDFYAHIGGFWQQLDPTPGTLYNERLIEHWERIAHIQASFTKNDRTVFGTDDRGEIYMKYGKADRVFTGTLYAGGPEVHDACAFLKRCNTDAMGPIVQIIDPIPRYEIWVYDRPSEEISDNLVFLFARTTLSGFRHFQTVEELIPTNTLQEDGIRAGSMSPAMVLQWIYYKQMAKYDSYFASKFNYMERNWVSTPANAQKIGPHQGGILSDRTRHEAILIENKAPAEKSTAIESLIDISVETYPYRFLTANGTPYYSLFVGSDSYQTIFTDLTLNAQVGSLVYSDSASLGTLDAEYELFHGINIQDEFGQITSRSRNPVALNLSNAGHGKSFNVYQVPALDEDETPIIYAELHNYSAAETSSPFDQSLRALGKISPELPEPLTLSDDELLLGDIILGYGMDYELEQAFIPFTPSHDKTIPMDEVLAMHFEVYNLATNEHGEGNFQFNYQITKPRSFQWIRGRANEVGLSATFATVGGIFSEDIEIQTRDLEEGKYTLEIEIRDLISNLKIERKIDFTIIEL